MKEIILVPNSGFCFGVRRAIAKAEETATLFSDSTEVNTCGALIHNDMVTDELKTKGIGIVEKPEEAIVGSTIIVRSHGEPRSFFEKAKDRNLRVVDATCPFVTKIHSLVKSAHEAGKQVIIIGDERHPEVIGTNGWCENSAIIINNKEDADIKVDNAIIVAQTTLKKESFDELVSIIAKKSLNLEIHNTICSATTERQNGTKIVAQQVDAMLIVGDKKSSNTKKLYEISKAYCKNTHFIENINNFSLKDIANCNKIGVAAGASTPENAIKEVIAKMSDNKTNNDEMMTMEELLASEDFEKSLRLPRAGELVTGTILEVTPEKIMVNLHCKRDGVIPSTEISLEEGQTLPDLFKEGEEIQAKVLKTDDGDGIIRLSRRKLEASAHWDEIAAAAEEGRLIDVEVIRKVNGGVIAVFKEVSGFIPLSQLSDRYVEDAEEFVGQTLTVRVTKVDQRRAKAVFSHKDYLKEERQKALAKVWENIHVDDIVEGTVMRFAEYGAFVDIGGVDGLLHISEISWGKLKHPSEALKKGQKVCVKVLSMNAEKGKISLGLKQTRPEPWSVIDEKYHIGDIVEGTVVQVKEYGCFVELEPGLDGLVHISEINYKRVEDINDEVKVGQTVKTSILDIDRELKRISLSIKATLEKPVEELEETVETVEAPVEAPVETVEAAVETVEAPVEDAE